MWPHRFLCSLLACLSWQLPSLAHAQSASETSGSGATKLDGDYLSSALREDYTVQSWLAACGPAPQSSSSGGGAHASVRENGDTLSIVSAGRSYRSDRCYDTSMPALRAESSQYDAATRTWRVRCATPASDPRKAMMQTMVAARGDRVDVVETGRYEIRLANGACIADVRRSQSFTRVVSAQADTLSQPLDAGSIDPASDPTTAPEGTEPPDTRCAPPGPASKLELSPTRKVAVAGSEFSVQVRVVDANACVLPPNLQLAEPAAITLAAKHTSDRSLWLRVPEAADEGTTTVTLKQGRASAALELEIVSRARYEELFSTGELGVLEELPEGSVPEPIRFHNEAPAVATDSEERRHKFLILVSGLLGLLVVAGIWLMIRRARGRARPPLAPTPLPSPVRSAERPPHPTAPPPGTGPRAPSAPAAPPRPPTLADTTLQAPVIRERRACPICASEFEPPLQFCPHDGAQLGSPAEATGMLCPICRRGFGPSIDTCPDHGEELVPKGSLGPEPTARRGKICPVCGDRVDAEVAFCGRDGAILVILN